MIQKDLKKRGEKEKKVKQNERDVFIAEKHDIGYLTSEIKRINDWAIENGSKEQIGVSCMGIWNEVDIF